MEQRVLGDYNLLKQIGQGSMGTVFLAEHRFMKKQFALKILPEELSSDRGFIQRFEEEVGLLASLDHPNIVKVHTVSFAQGAYFLVTECTVDSSGETTNLAQYLAARGDDLSEDEIYEILAQVASALDYAHTKKSGKGELIHCGLKLNNILVAKPDANHKIKVMLSDFGIYKIVGVSHVLARIMNNVVESLSGAMASSAESLVQGSPANLQKTNNFLQAFAFLSPEQKSGDKNSFIDGRSDVYAFGVLAYLLTNTVGLLD